MTCPRCQTANPDEHRFCAQCGVRLIERGGALAGSLREQLHHGLALLVEGEWGRAREQFRRCLELDPGHGPSALYLGLIDCLEGAPSRARDHLRRAVELDPQLVNGWLLLGLVAESEEDYAEAEECMTRAAELEPHALLARARLADLANARGDVEAALPELRRWADGQPHESAPLLHLASALSELEEWNDASDVLDRALELEPESAALHRRRGDLCRRTGARERAERHFAAALTLDPEDDETRLKHAILLADLGRVNDALAQLDEVLRRDPDSAVARYHRGLLLYVEKGQLDAALVELELAYALDPDDPSVRLIRQELILEKDAAP
ncbi:MAG: tetratricopeptide repeat protein [Candidatus Eisenbacteria bacterium]